MLPAPLVGIPAQPAPNVVADVVDVAAGVDAAGDAALLDADAMAAWIAALPMAANSGDIYASLEPGRIV